MVAQPPAGLSGPAGTEDEGSLDRVPEEAREKSARAPPAAGIVGGLVGSLELQGQASSARPRRRRLPTDYREEGGQTRTLGPWKSTSVESPGRRRSSAWELIGRRHTVDDRREALCEAKGLFLRVLAIEADGAWRAHAERRAGEIGAAAGRIRAGLSEQAQALKATAGYLAARSAADGAYFAELPASPGLLSAAAPSAPEAAQRRVVVQRMAKRSARLASELQAFLESHARAEGDISRTVKLATGDADASRSAEQEARARVWPEALPLLDDPLKGHGVDEGPAGTCAWLAVNRYLVACQCLQDAQSAAQARLHRKELHLAQLQVLVDNVLGQAISASLDSTPDSVPSVPELVLGDGASTCDAEHSNHGPSEDEGDDEDGPTAILSMEAAPLVIHQLAVDVCYTAMDETDEDAADEWISSYILVSVDLWLHVWGTTAGTADRSPSQSMPSHSIYLPRACVEPVAIGVSNQPRVLQLNFRKTPDTTSPASTSVLGGVADWAKGFLWKGQGAEGSSLQPLRDLRIRCASQDDATELLEVLGFVEKIYPALL